jgi:hypothetical protein
MTCWNFKENNLGLSAPQLSFYHEIYFPLKCFFSDLQKWKSLSTRLGLNGGPAKPSRNHWKAVVDDIFENRVNSPLVPQAWGKHEERQF